MSQSPTQFNNNISWVAGRLGKCENKGMGDGSQKGTKRDTD